MIGGVGVSRITGALNVERGISGESPGISAIATDRPSCQALGLASTSLRGPVGTSTALLITDADPAALPPRTANS
jgi:hypothetical protein